jgi:putative transposase
MGSNKVCKKELIYIDNANMENFFETIKSELFYLNKYESFTYLNKEINEYIKCHNKTEVNLI